jgi:hypothetical protein
VSVVQGVMGLGCAKKNSDRALYQSAFISEVFHLRKSAAIHFIIESHTCLPARQGFHRFLPRLEERVASCASINIVVACRPPHQNKGFPVLWLVSRLLVQILTEQPRNLDTFFRPSVKICTNSTKRNRRPVKVGNRETGNDEATRQKQSLKSLPTGQAGAALHFHNHPLVKCSATQRAKPLITTLVLSNLLRFQIQRSR